MKFNSVIAAVALGAVLAGCAGRAANPIMVHQYGDEKKSCQALEREMSFIMDEMRRLAPETEKTGKNVALGVAGAFLLVPWFFMDLSKAEQMELDAYRQRYNHLLIIAGDKNCDVDVEPIPDFKKEGDKTE